MIGILALQGAFQKHLDCIQKLGYQGKLVKTPQDLEACQALILPGGESTAHQKLISPSFWEALESFVHTYPVLGTCCGLILMANSVQASSMRTLNCLDVEVSRNAYGPQIASFETQLEVKTFKGKYPLRGCFIRAPQIVQVGPQVEVLAFYQNQPVIVQQGRAIGCTFHPEIFEDLLLHEHFISLLNAPVAK